MNETTKVSIQISETEAKLLCSLLTEVVLDESLARSPSAEHMIRTAGELLAFHAMTATHVQGLGIEGVGDLELRIRTAAGGPTVGNTALLELEVIEQLQALGKAGDN